MNEYLEIIKTCPLFRDITDDDLGSMLTCLGAKTERFDKRYTIIAEGSPAKYIGIVLSGSVSVEQTDIYGNRSILSVAGPSHIFGEAFACADVDAIPVSVVANEDSLIMFINIERILVTCSNNCPFHNKLIRNLMHDLAQKALMFHRKIDVISRRTTREKLLSYLNYEARRQGSGSFDIPFDRQGLADYLEVDRSGLSLEISKLRKEGILESRKNHFTLL